MPIYEYQCNDCGIEFEKRVPRVDDASSVVCPSCGKSHLTQRLSVFATVSQSSTSRSSAPSCPAGTCCPSAGTCGLS